MNFARPGHVISGTIGLFFGGLWGVLGALALPAPWQRLGIVFAGLVSIALAVGLWRGKPSLGAASTAFRRGPYIFAVVLEMVAISAAWTLLHRYGLGAYVIEAVGLIVGLHFVGLWKATALKRFLWIAGAMCGVSATAILLPHAWHGIDLGGAITGAGNALILWTGAGRSLGDDRSRPVPI